MLLVLREFYFGYPLCLCHFGILECVLRGMPRMGILSFVTSRFIILFMVCRWGMDPMSDEVEAFIQNVDEERWGRGGFFMSDQEIRFLIQKV